MLTVINPMCQIYFSCRITLPLSTGATLALALSACTATSPPAGEQAVASAAVPGGELDQITVVTCLLPGQIRRLGGQFTVSDRPPAHQNHRQRLRDSRR